MKPNWVERLLKLAVEPHRCVAPLDEEDAWWAWHDEDPDRHHYTMAEADGACAAWVRGESDVGPDREERLCGARATEERTVETPGVYILTMYLCAEHAREYDGGSV